MLRNLITVFKDIGYIGYKRTARIRQNEYKTFNYTRRHP